MKKILLPLLLVMAIFSEAQVSLTGASYNENFDGIGSGLPTGFSVYTGATGSATGSVATYTPSNTSWSNLTGGFYNCASATGLVNTANPNQQAVSTNRALSIRQTASYGNPGGAFVFRIDNTLNKTGFNLTFKLQTLDSTSQGISAWRVDYGFGANPTTFNLATVTPTTFSTGGKTGTSFYVFNRTMSVNFGATLDNKSDIVWVRVWTPVNTADPNYSTAYTLLGFNNTTPTMSGIDDWNLSWTNTPPTNVSSLSKSLELVKISGFIGNDVQVIFNKAYAAGTIARLTNMNGAIIWEKQFGRIQANQTEWIRAGQLPKGIYVLQLENAEGRLIQRLVN
jgi:hypothetical protein